jgi:type IV pilus assembly protein PilA
MVRRESYREQDGFTLPELLVVVLIVAILAAISLAVFLRQKDTAHDGVAKAGARELVSLVEACNTEQGDYRRCDTAPALDTSGIDLGSGPGEVEVSTSAQHTYTVRAVSQSGNWYAISRTATGMAQTCGTPAHAGCPAGGDW